MSDYGGHVYALVRRDLSPSQQAVQAAHAAIEASRKGLIPPDTPHPHLIICTTPDINGLIKCAERLDGKVKFEMFCEPDIDNKPTALCTEPLVEGRKLFSNYPLLKG